MILQLPVEELDGYRIHALPADPVLVAGIEEHGFRIPVTVATDGQRAVLVDGNHRLDAAEQLGMESLPCVITRKISYLRRIELHPPLGPELARWWVNGRH